MLEKDIEQKVIDKIASAFADNAINGIQIVGAWQTVDVDQLKAHEETGKGACTVKVYPRQYATPTIADASMQIDVNLLVRSDVDTRGADFLQVTEALASIFQTWQHSYSNYHDDFVIADRFEPTGYQQDGGDIGNDSANGIWTYSMSMTLNGVICWQQI